MKSKLLVILCTILTVTSLLLLYNSLVIWDSQNKFEEVRRKFYTIDNRIKLSFDLSNDSYLLKTTYEAGSKQNPEFRFNEVKFTANTFPYERKRGAYNNVYIHLPREIVKQGRNSLEIVFPDSPPSQVHVILRNYRKYTGEGIYILFSDSAHLPASKIFFRFHPFSNILILSLGIMTYLLGRNVFISKDRPFLYQHRYLLLLLFVLLLFILTGWIGFNLGYGVVITPNFFWNFVFIILAPLLAILSYKILKWSPISFTKAAEFCFTEKKFDIRIGIAFLLLIIAVNLYIYWPCFFHLFRHDEWFLFFSSKEVTPNLEFIIKHIDWQLKLPYDRLVFRPIHHGALALNRVIFDTNYIGPHILTFIKHILATLCLWWLMWRCNRRWISILFALLFSVLIVNMDPVMFPHFDAYIMIAIFTILAIITFRKTVYNQIPAVKGFVLTGLLLFLNILTTEIAFLMPIFFFCAYWTIFRNRDEIERKQEDKGSWLMLSLPMILWSIFYAIHLSFAYPDLAMTSQSDMIGLLMPLVNLVRFVLALLLGTFFPMFTNINYGDKIYFKVSYVGVVCLIVSMFFCIRFRGKIFRPITKQIIFSTMLIFSILIIICFGRASYINSLLNHNNMSSNYVYCISALVIFIIYTFFDFDKIAANKKLSLSLLLILAFLVGNHAFKTHLSAVEIERQTEPLKKYFDSVKRFVKEHKKEPNFSFKMIDRPPKIGAFQWYHETCIDGLFNRFINNKRPKYILEYDYASRNLTSYIYDKKAQPIMDISVPTNIQKEADYVNSIGMQFKKVSGQRSDFLMGMFEVTKKQWKDVMDFNPSKFKDGNHPVVNVSYHMVQEFIKRLNKTESVNLYRLPTETEYLHLSNLFISNFGGQNKNIHKYAWLKDNAEGTTHSVGRLSPMFIGFYDLIGNVWEWTGNPIDYNSVVKPLEDNPRICFGGSWRDRDIDIDNLTTNYPVDFRHEHLGFRLVREIQKWAHE